MASAIEELNLKFYLALINLNSHTGLVATSLDSAALNSLRSSPIEIHLMAIIP
jgi:hypothetical protein